MFLSVILYGIFAVFTFFILFQNLTKKVWFQAILLERKISRIALFCQFLRIFMIFKETSLLRDDPKSSEMDGIMISASIQNTNLVRNTKIDVFFNDNFWSSLNSGISFRYRWNMISACIQNTNLTRNLSKSIKKNTICNKKTPIFCNFIFFSCSTGRAFSQNVSTFR